MKLRRRHFPSTTIFLNIRTLRYELEHAGRNYVTSQSMIYLISFFFLLSPIGPSPSTHSPPPYTPTSPPLIPSSSLTMMPRFLKLTQPQWPRTSGKHLLITPTIPRRHLIRNDDRTELNLVNLQLLLLLFLFLLLHTHRTSRRRAKQQRPTFSMRTKFVREV